MQTFQEVSCGVCGNVLSRAAKESLQSSAHLDLALPKEEELVRHVHTSVSLGCGDHEMLVSQISRELHQGLLRRASPWPGSPQPLPLQAVSLSQVLDLASALVLVHEVPYRTVLLPVRFLLNDIPKAQEWSFQCSVIDKCGESFLLWVMDTHVKLHRAQESPLCCPTMPQDVPVAFRVPETSPKMTPTAGTLLTTVSLYSLWLPGVHFWPLSKNHRMDEVGMDLWSSSVPSSMLKQGHLELVSQDHGWRPHNFPGQAVPVLSHPHSEKVFPDVQRVPPVFQFVPIVSFPVFICIIKIPSEPSLLQAKLFQLSQPFLMGEMLQSLGAPVPPSTLWPFAGLSTLCPCLSCTAEPRTGHSTPGYLSLLPRSVSFLFVLEFGQELLVHPHRSPGIFVSLRIHWDGALLCLEEVILEY
ncbi:hypothetical protein QYF61_021349 [Mycteria americana]|uniref:Uncharacterized protein n=1 Tax=Mycteria americana TaxID=33587 RepID=A0AAN7NA61_MYCAM|nr:hypothetical protein QYF61_021349 [Mycteria americana]